MTAEDAAREIGILKAKVRSLLERTTDTIVDCERVRRVLEIESGMLEKDLGHKARREILYGGAFILPSTKYQNLFESVLWPSDQHGGSLDQPICRHFRRMATEWLMHSILYAGIPREALMNRERFYIADNGFVVRTTLAPKVDGSVFLVEGRIVYHSELVASYVKLALLIEGFL